ncbi:MAG: hypothetical protein PHV93_04495 [Candidatus Pacebacteria bacterium]|nr:hypothetical protein [Candidatus Paceibacterota bacterium]
MTELERKIRKELIRIVKIGDENKIFIRYTPLADKFEISYPQDNEYERGLFHDMLCHISEYEGAQGRPMLSAIVVNEEHKPGPGFFSLAKELHRKRFDEDPDAFYLREIRALLDYWKNHDDPDR